MDLNDKITTIVKYLFMIVYSCSIIYLLRQDYNTASFWFGVFLLIFEGYDILYSDLKETKQNDVENKQEEETENKIEIYRWKDYWW
jgi:putative Mn2+ efflux pump MntP